MESYGFQTAGQIIAGKNSIDRIGEITASRGFRKVLLVTDSGVRAVGLPDRLVSSLRQKGVSVDLLDGVTPEPPAESVENLFDQIRPQRYDLLVGLGGGSVLDVTKLLSVRYTNNNTVFQMIDGNEITNSGVPTLMVPTTAGTGSEVTPNAIVTLVDQQLKVGIVSRHLLPQIVIADPTLTFSLPPAVTAATGMDAFIHALESFISKKRNLIADAFCLESMRLINRSIESAYLDGTDLEARHDMLIGALLGGMALSASGTAAVHALAYPLGGKYGISHGVSNSMLLVPVLEYNLDAIGERLVNVAKTMNIDTRCLSSFASAEAVLARIKDLIKRLSIPVSLEDFGAHRDDLDDLALRASKISRLLDNNPKTMPLDAIRRVYESLLK